MQTLAIFALTLLLTASSAQGLNWEEIPQNAEVKPEKSVILRCRVSGDYVNMRWLGKRLGQEVDLLYLKTPGKPAMTFNHPGFEINDDFDLKILVSLIIVLIKTRYLPSPDLKNWIAQKS